MSPILVRRLAWMLVGALGGLGLLLTLPERPVATVPGAAPPSTRAELQTARVALTDDHTDEPTRTTAPAQGLSPALRTLELGGDLHALARELLPAATAGDTESQYGLALVVRECHFELSRNPDRAAFDRFLEGVPRRSGIDPQQYAALQRDRFVACDGFRDDPIDRYGSDAEWFSRAAAGGHPIATLELELRKVREAKPRDAEALHDAAVAALATRRPDAFLLLLELEFPDEDGPATRDAAPNATAWRLLACQRGYPCGPEARWRREQFAFRGSQRAELGWDDALLFDMPAHEREQARDRAAELARALDAGELDAVLPLPLREPQP